MGSDGSPASAERELGSLKRLAALRKDATDFAHASRALLRELLNFIEEALWDGVYAADAHVQRGLIHLRSDSGYRSLVSVDRRDNPPEWLRPSTNAWRWVAQTGRTLSIDITTGEVRPARELENYSERYESMPLWQPGDTQIQLLERDTTHLLAVPVAQADGAPLGMVSIELTCRPAIGDSGIWSGCIDHCETLVSLATPWLLSLPDAAPRDDEHDPLLPVVGQRMHHMLEFIRAFADQRETLLISGPSGAGKTRLARWCHQHSPVADGPFEVIDLLAVPADMQLAELTGWKRGAFTGAISDHDGALARARGGTLLIDEIDNLSLKAQAGLLQILETGTFRPLGSSASPRDADVRFIVGTNTDLHGQVREGRFREDLYYRINVLPIGLPGLEDRRDEIGEWANFMAERRHAETHASGRSYVAIDAAAELVSRTWPGNLRQLDNVIRRAYSMAAAKRAGEADVVIRLEDVNVALSLDGSGGQDLNLVSSLLRAASAFVDEAVKRNQGSAELRLEHTNAFTGLVLMQTLARLKTRKAAYLLFGREAQIENRNYNREINRELERVQEFLRVVGDVDLAQLVTPDGDE